MLKQIQRIQYLQQKALGNFFFPKNQASSNPFGTHLLRNPKDLNSQCMHQRPHFLLSGDNGWDGCWQNIQSPLRETSCQVIIRQQGASGNRVWASVEIPLNLTCFKGQGLHLKSIWSPLFTEAVLPDTKEYIRKKVNRWSFIFTALTK